MYNGNETLINNGEYLSYSMLDFWSWAYSNLLLNVSRGTFAEFIVKSATRYTGIPLKDLRLRSNNLIACIARKNQIIIPNGDDCIEPGDSVIVVTMEPHVEDIADILM